MSLTLAGVESEERKARALEALRKVGLEAQAKKNRINFPAVKCNALQSLVRL